MKKSFLILLLIITGAAANHAQAQRHKIAVFAPLYLDSAFNYSGNYVFNKNFPKFLNPGIEFYQGVQHALDSLQKAGAPLEVFIYDTKARTASLAQQLKNPELNDVEMIIAQSSAPETKLLADIAQAKKIPFISATLPNDAGADGNPYLVVLNTTLQGHIEGMYKMLQRTYALDNIIIFRKAGPQEDAIQNNFTEYGKATASMPLKVKYVDIGVNFNSQTLLPYLDSTRRNVIVAGSMEEYFGTKLAASLSPLSKKYTSLLVGMPTWDNVNFNKTEFKGLDIVYSTPFFYNRLTPLESRLAADFEKNIGSRPTDMYFRGYESVLRFALLLLETNKDVASNLTRKGNVVFTRFDIQPVFKNKQTMTLDYFENKNVYFVRVSNGAKRLM
jgi:ABC-type branched-subunit amino acid transport system substrate-binding protein